MAANIMGQSVPQLRRWSRGQPLDHRQLNEPVEAINRMMAGVGPPRQVMPSVAGTPSIAARVGRVLLAMEAGVTDDHLVCRAVDSDPAAYVPILVAKPQFLRKTPWDGQTRDQVRYVYDVEDSTQRTAYDVNDLPGIPEAERNKRTETISPQYLIDDELVSMPLLTGVVVAGVDDEGQPIAVPVNLIDMTGAREWTVFFERL